MVERQWDDSLLSVIHGPTPKHMRAEERAKFYLARSEAQRQLDAFFPPDEE